MSVGLVLRSLLWSALLPGFFAGYVPYRYFGLADVPFDHTRRDHIAGLVLMGVGVALLAACIFQFARSGRGTLSPVDSPRELVVRGLYATFAIRCTSLCWQQSSARPTKS